MPRRLLAIIHLDGILTRESDYFGPIGVPVEDAFVKLFALLETDHYHVHVLTFRDVGQIMGWAHEQDLYGRLRHHMNRGTLTFTNELPKGIPSFHLAPRARLYWPNP